MASCPRGAIIGVSELLPLRPDRPGGEGSSTADTPQPGPEDPALSLQGPTSSWACGAPPVPYSDIHLATLPPEHTVVFLLRLLPETPREAFALWQVASEDFQPILGVLLDGQLEGQQWARRCSGGVPSCLPCRGLM